MRIFFSIGCRGFLIRNVQKLLKEKGFYTGTIDGSFFTVTKKAIENYQEEYGLVVDSTINSEVWKHLFNSEAPTIWQRCLQFTSVLEGHSFTLIQGNWDGAGLTWGIIGFTAKSGTLQKVLQRAEKWWPGILLEKFGKDNLEILKKNVLDTTNENAVKFGDSISLGNKRVVVQEKWKNLFFNLGNDERLELAQCHVANELYYKKAKSIIDELEFKTELGYGLVFDTVVQSGVKRIVIDKVNRWNDLDERNRRDWFVEYLIQLQIPTKWDSLVRSRKSLFISGKGELYGQSFDLKTYGLSEEKA